MVGGFWPAPPEKQFHGARHSFEVKLVDREHPVTRGFADHFVATDELYHGMTLTASAHVLATAYSRSRHRRHGPRRADPVGQPARQGPRLFHGARPRGRGHAERRLQGRAPARRRMGGEGTVTLPVDAGAVKAKPDALRLLVVTGGHDFPTSFYTLFEGRPEWRWTHAPSNGGGFRARTSSRATT